MQPRRVDADLHALAGARRRRLRLDARDQLDHLHAQMHERLGAEVLDDVDRAPPTPLAAARSRRSSARTPTDATVAGSASTSPLARAARASSTFISGVPMNCATNRLAGRS